MEAFIMINFKPRIWTSIGLGAIALIGVGACQQGDGENGEAGAPVGKEAALTAKSGEGDGEGAKAEKNQIYSAVSPAIGGESGEAGAQNAYGTVAEGSRLGLRIAHVTGFLLIAQKAHAAGQAEEASALISQGLLEVYMPNAVELDKDAKGLKTAFEKVVADLDAKKPTKQISASFAEAIKVARKAEAASGATPQDMIAGMLSIAAGLYSGAIAPNGNDPIEYQHAQGAALAALAAFDHTKSDLSNINAQRTETLGRDLAVLLALFPDVTLPDSPASVAQVTGAASRAQLTLSGIRNS